MLSATRPHSLEATFPGMPDVNHNIQDVRTPSGQVCVTPEVHRELKRIENGINHIRLDHDISRSSQGWGNTNATAIEKKGEYGQKYV